MKEKIDWIIKQHKDTNHMYGDYLPYEFHLRMTVSVCNRFLHHLEPVAKDDVIIACYGHDLIEDARVTYNDVKNVLGYRAAELIYAMTNEKGKNRKERANEKYYQGLREIKYGVFVKLCDRIANVEYSKMIGSGMFELYQKENENFMKELGYNQNSYYKDMFKHLETILK